MSRGRRARAVRLVEQSPSKPFPLPMRRGAAWSCSLALLGGGGGRKTFWWVYVLTVPYD